MAEDKLLKAIEVLQELDGVDVESDECVHKVGVTRSPKYHPVSIILSSCRCRPTPLTERFRRFWKLFSGRWTKVKVETIVPWERMFH